MLGFGQNSYFGYRFVHFCVKGWPTLGYNMNWNEGYVFTNFFLRNSQIWKWPWHYHKWHKAIYLLLQINISEKLFYIVRDIWLSKNWRLPSADMYDDDDTILADFFSGIGDAMPLAVDANIWLKLWWYLCQMQPLPSVWASAKNAK